MTPAAAGSCAHRHTERLEQVEQLPGCLEQPSHVRSGAISSSNSCPGHRDARTIRTVRVPRLCRLERTAAVQHLVSTVTGRLALGRDAFDLLAASFPGGSITGAPKIRAMEILEGLEPVRRGPYTGALGWIGPDGAMQTSILIRTFVADGRRLTLHVGGGITWGSDPGAEWDETVAKARGPLEAIGGIEVPA